MLGKPINLPFRVFGVPVGFDWSFLIVLPWFIYIMSRNVISLAGMLGIDPGATGLNVGITPWVIGTFAAAGLFLSVLVHEFGHVLTARGFGVRTRHVTLWLLGGVAAFDRIPRQPGAEAIIAIVGPITSLGVAGVFWLATLVTPIDVAPAVYTTFALLAIVNLTLAIFNLIPALPLDGGRVLRSLLALGLPWNRATQFAAWVSKGIAILLFAGALYSGNWFWLLIAGFIWLAVSAETRQSTVETSLRGMPIRSMMQPDVVAVRPDATLGNLVATMFRRRHSSYPVIGDDGQLNGSIGLGDLEEGYDPEATVSSIMRTDLPQIPIHADAFTAFQLMGDKGVDRLTVVDKTGRMIGLLTKSDLMRAMQLQEIRRAGGPNREPQLAGETTFTPAEDPVSTPTGSRPVV